VSDLKRKIWLWGQKPSGYDNSGYGLPKGNKMTPTEGLNFFGIENLCRVKLSAEANQSFLDDLWLGEPAKKLCLSLIGAGGEVPRDDMDDILTIAQKDSRVVSAVMDDFISEKRMKVFTPDVLHGFVDRLHNGIDRKLELWSVLYERDFDITPKDRAKIFDVTTFWTWYADNLNHYEENFKRMSDIVDGGRMMLGVYMYDFGSKKILPDELMRRQLDFVGNKLATGEVEGAILCSNVIADIGFTTVDIMRDWLNSL